MKNIVMIAPPGAGKGTQSELLMSKYGYMHISTGDLIREEMAKGTELGKSVEQIMKSGHFVSTEIVTELLEKCLKEMNNEHPFILDGYPRKLEQCTILDSVLKRIEKSIDVVFYLEMTEEEAKNRILGRMTCPKCHHSFNRFSPSRMPKVEGICDDCHSLLETRSDDTEETFKTRYQEFIQESKPILSYYENLGILKRIDNSGTPEETFSQIESVIQ